VPPSDESLPIEALREQVCHQLTQQPVVITAPTGSGKSTQVPRWCAGQVVVVEPRRVACKTLAARVAELEGCELGGEVGFHVRDHHLASDATRILFVTPGMALRRFAELAARDVVIVDEFHERALDVDLLLALLVAQRQGQLAVMSATLDGVAVARYVEGIHLEAQGRQFPVSHRHLGSGAQLPDRHDLPERVVAALSQAADLPGDVLVFLPGKAEIGATAAALSGWADVEVIELHGGLTLAEQSRAFRPCALRKIVLATNVAETSVTVPGIGVVIDSGLVRRTRYHRGRGFLTLSAIAADSAEQRAGRAGRTGPGVCLRLWSEAARLERATPPEIRRESLLPLVLGAAACGERVDDLRFLDEPTDYAVAAAKEEAGALGALDDGGRITDTGRDLYGLPLDPPLGRLLVEAAKRDTLADAIDLVSVLAVGRPLFERRGAPVHPSDDLRVSACDATANIRALREGKPRHHGLRPHALEEARSNARRLRKAFGLPAKRDDDFELDREALVRTAMAADPRAAHVARHRRGRTYWSNGGTEIELARDSAVHRAQHPPEAMVVFETRAFAKDLRRTTVMATCGSPVPLPWLVKENLGKERVARVKRHRDGRLVAVVERVFARKVLVTRESEPTGALAREAMAQLILRGSLFAEVLVPTRERIRDATLANRLAARGKLELPEGLVPPSGWTVEGWFLHRLAELGVEGAEDLELLSPGDVLFGELPYEVRDVLDREFPREVSTADARYAVEVDLDENEVTLRYVQGNRGRTPSLASLPAFVGFSIRVDTGNGLAVLRR